MTDSTKPPELLRLADKTQVTLNYAVNLQILAAQVGFDWPDINDNGSIMLSINPTTLHEWICTSYRRGYFFDTYAR